MRIIVCFNFCFFILSVQPIPLLFTSLEIRIRAVLSDLENDTPSEAQRKIANLFPLLQKSEYTHFFNILKPILNEKLSLKCEKLSPDEKKKFRHRMRMLSLKITTENVKSLRMLNGNHSNEDEEDKSNWLSKYKEESKPNLKQMLTEQRERMNKIKEEIGTLGIG